jgi:hydrogenase expression/formation protein HypD
VRNQYARAVQRRGNEHAQELMTRVFEITDRKWRGIGSIPASGLTLRAEFAEHDAALRFNVADLHADEPDSCMAGAILQGLRKPDDCPAFGTGCTPERPLGAPMVSNEGACSAYYRYGRTG